MILTSSIAHADDIDWNSAPRFNNLKAFVTYLENTRKTLRNKVFVIFTDRFLPSGVDVASFAHMWRINYTNYGNNGSNTYMLYDLSYYPGERVAWAYLHNDISFLNREEYRLYNEAVKVVNNAKQFAAGHSADGLYYELYFHDEIAKRTTYYNKNPQPPYARFQTALGVFLDGKANCQGYSDAFKMLCQMARINADMVTGEYNNTPHVWNTVTYGDGKYYFMDVTLDDNAFQFSNVEQNSYIYFNAPKAVMTMHRWYSDYTPPIQQTPNGNYFYFTSEFNNSKGKYFGAWSHTAEDALQFIAQRIANGWNYTRVCVLSYDEKYANADNALNHLLYEILPRYNWAGDINIQVEWRGNYMFFTVQAIPNF